MDSQKPNRSVQGRRNKISIETYLEFSESQKQLDLTIDQLNHIIAIHGFKKLHKCLKTTVVEALSKIDLMSLNRSTLKDNISSSVVISPKEAMEDLNILNWQECTVTSFEIINPLNETTHQQLLSNHNTNQHQQLLSDHNTHQHQHQIIHNSQKLIIEKSDHSNVMLKPKSKEVDKENMCARFTLSKKPRPKVVAKETLNSNSVQSVVSEHSFKDITQQLLSIGNTDQHQQPSIHNAQQNEQLIIENSDHSDGMSKPKSAVVVKENVCPLFVSKKPISKVAVKETSNLDSVRSVVKGSNSDSAKNVRATKKKRKALHEIVDRNDMEISLG